MRIDPNPTMPPHSLLKALRQPRRQQLGDPCVKGLLAQWKKLRLPIEYADLWQVLAIIAPGEKAPCAKTRRKIVAAVEAAGIEIHNYDGFCKGLAETFVHVQLTGDAMFAIVEESRWREPEEWDATHSQPRPPAPPPEWLKESMLDQEYGPTPERFRWQERRRQGGLLWFLDVREELVSKP